MGPVDWASLRGKTEVVDLPEPDPNVCKCCGQVGILKEPCECQEVPEWYMNEAGEVECNMHRIKRWMREEIASAKD